MKQNKLRTLYEKDMTKKILASLLSILIGLVVGSVIIAAVGFSNPELGASSVWDGFRLVFAGLFSTGRTASGVLTWGFNSTNFGNMLFRATPLIMTGLSVAVAFKTGLFNIGAPGQYLMGTLVSLCIALGIPSSSVAPWLIWILAFLGGVAAGAVWGAIPGALKAFLNINEVLASIMTNWLAANLVTWMFDISNFKNMVESTKSGYIYKTTFNGVATPKLGLDAIFPGSQGGPLEHIIAAKAVCFGEALKPEFKAYAEQIVKNAKVLAEELVKEGFRLVSGGTDNHLCLVDVRNFHITGKEFERRLDEVQITVNKNAIPNDPEKPFVTSGVRVGTPAVTSRGFKEPEMVQIAHWMGQTARDFDTCREQVRSEVDALCRKFPIYQ